MNIMDFEHHNEHLENLSSKLDDNAMQVGDKIIITYDAGKKYSEDEYIRAKEKIVAFLRALGINDFYSPTRSTLIFFIDKPEDYSSLESSLKEFFDKEISSESEFYYSIGFVPHGKYYVHKSNDDLKIK